MILKCVWSVAKRKNKTNLHLYQSPGAFEMSPAEKIVFICSFIWQIHIEPIILEADDPTVNKTAEIFLF